MLVRTRALAVVLAAGGAVPAAPAEAAAVPFQIVTFRNMFLSAESVVVAGGSLELTNVDLERHDVTSNNVENGQPVFRSATIGPGHTVVVGVENLEPNVYPFYCSVHSEMVGNLTVV